MNKSFSKILAIVLVLSGVYFFSITIYRAVANPILLEEIPFINFRSNEEVDTPREKPKKIVIPSLGIEAIIEEIGVNSKKKIANPSNFKNVGWFKYGPRPGERGVAFFAGHLDNGLGLKGVFKEIGSLERGQEIKILDEKGNLLTFEVTEIQKFPFDAKIDESFFKSDQRKIALVTCGGSWLRSRQQYSERVVVFAKLLK